MSDKPALPILLIPAAPPTFAEYQLIHQTQERQRHPDSEATRPVTSDPWRQKLQLWFGFTGATGLLYWLWGPGRIVGWAFVVAVFTGLGLLYQHWEYRRAFREQQAQPHPESLELTDAGLRLHFPAGRVFYSWESLPCIRWVGDWLLFYPGMEFCYYLDLHRLPAPLTVADVAQLLAQQQIWQQRME